MIRTTLSVLAVLLVAAAVIYGALVAIKGRKGALAVLFGEIQREPIDFQHLRLKGSPNQYLVCPDGLCTAKAHATSPEFPVSIDELQRAWFAMLEKQPSTEIISSDEEKRQFDIETLTPLVGYPDTVTVRFLEIAEDLSTFAVYSRSHYGHSDLGVNKKRIDRWLSHMVASVGEID